MSRLGFFVLPILLGLIRGLLGWWTYDVGMFEQWRDLPADFLRPHKPIDILGGDFDAAGIPYIYVETTEGNTYSCQRPSDMLILDKCRVQTDSPQIGANGEGCETHHRDVARRRRFVISDPPGTTTDRIRLELCGSSSSVYEYALLEDSTVRVWRHVPKYPWDMIGIALSVGMGGCPGVSVGLVLSYLGRRWLQQGLEMREPGGVGRMDRDLRSPTRHAAMARSGCLQSTISLPTWNAL